MSFTLVHSAHRAKPAQSFARRRYQRAIDQLQALEPRVLMTATVSPPFTVPGISANGAVYVSNGDLWVYDVDSEAMVRIKNNAVDTAVGSTIPLDPGTYAPFFFAAGSNGHIYASDLFGGIDDINTVTGNVTPDNFVGSNFAEQPNRLAVTSNGAGGDAVWFVGSGATSTTLGAGGITITQHVSTIGRWDASTDAVTTLVTGPALSDSVAAVISAKGSDSVWVSLNAADDSNGIGGFAFGTNRILSASFDGTTVQQDYTFNVNTSDSVANASGGIESIVSDGGGGLWFTLSNVTSDHTVHNADELVHASSDGSTQTATVVHNSTPSDTVATPGTRWNIDSLSVDVNGNVWFEEREGAQQFGYFNGTNFTTFANPTSASPFELTSNNDGTALTWDLTGADFTVGYPIVQVAVTPDLAFSGSANDLSAREGTAITSTLLATFTAPPPSGTYSATINWGDGTCTVVTPSYMGGDTNTYCVVISSKTFATQGTYPGTVSINDSGAGLVGTMPFTSRISDIPLNVTSVTAIPLLLRIVAVAGTFTDDSGLPLSTWTATINWGDGSSSTGLIVRDPTQSGRYIVLALHQYRTRGTYSVKFTVTTTEPLAAVTNSSLTTSVSAR